MAEVDARGCDGKGAGGQNPSSKWHAQVPSHRIIGLKDQGATPFEGWPDVRRLEGDLDGCSLFRLDHHGCPGAESEIRSGGRIETQVGDVTRNRAAVGNSEGSGCLCKRLDLAEVERGSFDHQRTPGRQQGSPAAGRPEQGDRQKP